MINVFKLVLERFYPVNNEYLDEWIVFEPLDHKKWDAHPHCSSTNSALYV
jgi:hypothetical protein